MAAARGDSKPCTRTPCVGRMQFGREPQHQMPGIRAVDGARGWVCSEKAEHFQRESEMSGATATSRDRTMRVRAAAGWDDDGGA